MVQPSKNLFRITVTHFYSVIAAPCILNIELSFKCAALFIMLRNIPLDTHLFFCVCVCVTGKPGQLPQDEGTLTRPFSSASPFCVVSSFTSITNFMHTACDCCLCVLMCACL